jgi:WD40 repeat protein
MAAFTDDGKKIVVWLRREISPKQYVNTAQVIDRDGKVLHWFTERENSVSCMAFTPDGDWAALGSESGSVRLWDLVKNESIGGNMPVHQKRVNDLVFSADKKMLITGDEAGEIKIWDLPKREAIKTIQAHKSGLLAINLSPDGKRFVTVGGNGEIRLWDLAKGEKIKEWQLETPIRNLVFSADGTKLFTANGDTTLYQIDLP